MSSLQRAPRVIGPDDWHALLSLGRGGSLPPSWLEPVHDVVAAIARRDPGAIAVAGEGDVLTYGELASSATHLSEQLAALGVVPRSRVALLVEPSPAMAVAVLGVLGAGAAYVPIDCSLPTTRVRDIVRDADVCVVVTTESRRAHADGLTPPVVTVEELAGRGDRQGVGRLPAAAPTDPAYLIYTSGTTGEPKGVLVEHAHLAASTAARRSVYGDGGTFLLLSPLAFDSSVAGFWGTLTTGGRLVVPTADETRDPERLVELIHHHLVTRLLCVPSLYGVLLDAAERAGGDALASLDQAIVAGEPLQRDQIDRHFALPGGRTSLVNEYGPTEATVWATYRWYDEPGPSSIGGPIPGTTVYVLDERLELVPRGEVGELFIGGPTVARGYFRRPDATARSFVVDPFGDQVDARMYRSGDLVRWDNDGRLEFLGRRDHQVKIRGHRVELGAIEATIRRIPGVRDAAAVPNSAGTLVVAFVVASPEVTPASVSTFLAGELPAVMVPSSVHLLECLPHTFSGKVDRAALVATADHPLPAPSSAVEQGGSMRSLVAAAWAEVLDTVDVPADVNFFDLGGHSLKMFELQDALERHTGTRPSVVTLFRHATVSEQASLLDGGGEGSPGAGRFKAGGARRLRSRHGRPEPEAIS